MTPPASRPPARSLVIGASGFLGSRVTRLLVHSGESVRVMVRPTSATAAIDDLEVERVVGELTDSQALAAAMAGVRDVYYCVVDARAWLPDSTPLWRTNVELLESVLPVAAAAGLRKFVFTSSVVTVVAGGDDLGAYVQTRVAAEQRLLAACRQGLPGVAMCVSNTYGPGDLAPTPHGRFVMLAAFGQLPLYPAGAESDVVGIDDAAHALILAADRGEVGQRYAVTESRMTVGAIVRTAAAAAGVPAPRLAVPLPALKAVGFAWERIARLTGGTPQLTPVSVRLMELGEIDESVPNARVLGWSPLPTTEAIRAAAGFYLDERDRRRSQPRQ